jgi:hypothetical protein
MAGTGRRCGVSPVKKKGCAGKAVQPKSREETPKVGTPWRVGPTTALPVIWACSCCGAISRQPRAHISGRMWQRSNDGRVRPATLVLFSAWSRVGPDQKDVRHARR